MKTSLVWGFIVATTFAAFAAFAAEDSDRPAGVEAKDWLWISERLGFVVTEKKEFPGFGGGSRQILLADPAHVSADLMPPKKGYFVIKTRNGWQRVTLSDLADVAG